MGNINCLQCEFRHPDNGNCTGVGGLCTAVPAAYCPLLRQYLGTGMTPGQAANAKTIIESAFAEDTSKAEQIRKLLAADNEGRCIILPRKVGDTVWRIKWTFETYPDKSEPYIEPDTFLLQDVFNIGKTVFLTREEADHELKRVKGW